MKQDLREKLMTSFIGGIFLGDMLSFIFYIQIGVSETYSKPFLLIIFGITILLIVEGLTWINKGFKWFLMGFFISFVGFFIFVSSIIVLTHTHFNLLVWNLIGPLIIFILIHIINCIKKGGFLKNEI